MATGFPTSLDALTNPLSTDALTSPSHADQHANANDAIEALQAKVGVNSSAVTTSLDYKVGLITGRNVIINGAMQISQRGISTTVTGNTFLIDRWIHACSGSNTTIRDTASVPTGFKYAWKWTSGGSGVYSVIAQQIEYQNFIQMVGQTVTLSFYAKANTTNAGSTAFVAATRTSTSEDTAVYFSGTYTPASFTLTTSWARYSTQFTIGATVKSLAIEFLSGTASATVSTDGVAITGVQLEVGSVATPFEFEDIGTTLAKCQRYYQTTTDGVCAGLGNGTTEARFTLPLLVTLRASPTTTLAAGTSYAWRHNGAVASTSTSITVLGFYNNFITFNLPGFSGMSDGYAVNVSINGRQLSLSSEL